MEQSDDDFLKFSFFFFNIGAPRIMALLVPVHFLYMREVLREGFVLTKIVGS